MPAIALWTPEDKVLSALAPLGAALAAPPAVVVDLDPEGPPYPGDASLRELVDREPTESELSPGRGVAVIRNGGVAPSAASEVVAALLARWPRVVLRLPSRTPDDSELPVVPVRLLLPGWLASRPEPAVWQSTPHWVPMPADGVRLPVPSLATVQALSRGRIPARSGWVRAWRSVWRLPWVG